MVVCQSWTTSELAATILDSGDVEISKNNHSFSWTLDLEYEISLDGDIYYIILKYTAEHLFGIGLMGGGGGVIFRYTINNFS